MKKDKLKIKLKVDSPSSTQLLENYADKVKTNQNETQTENTTDARVEQDKTVILGTYCSSRQIRKKFRDSIEIKRALASKYPYKKLLYALFTAHASIHLELTTPEQADCFVGKEG